MAWAPYRGPQNAQKGSGKGSGMKGGWGGAGGVDWGAWGGDMDSFAGLGEEYGGYSGGGGKGKGKAALDPAGAAKGKSKGKSKGKATAKSSGPKGEHSARHPNDSINNPKNQLNVIVTVLKGGPPVKGDVEYTVEDIGGSMQATVTVNLPTGVQAFAGEVVEGTSEASVKQSKFNAAAQAGIGLNDAYEARLPEFQAEKAAKAALREAQTPEMGDEPATKKAKTEIDRVNGKGSSMKGGWSGGGGVDWGGGKGSSVKAGWSGGGGVDWSGGKGDLTHVVQTASKRGELESLAEMVAQALTQQQQQQQQGAEYGGGGYGGDGGWSSGQGGKGGDMGWKGQGKPALTAAVPAKGKSKGVPAKGQGKLAFDAAVAPKGKSKGKEGKSKAKVKREQTLKEKENELRPHSDRNPNDNINNPKNQLNVIVTVLKGAPPVKGDMDYTVEDVGGSLQATVTVKLPTGVQAFAGEVVAGIDKDSRKQAMFTAAEQAGIGLNDAYEARLPEFQAEKAAKAALREAQKAEKMG